MTGSFNIMPSLSREGQLVELVYFTVIPGIISLITHENMMAIKHILLAIFLTSVAYVRCDELRFLVVGDWGGMPWFPYTTPYETAVSIAMGKVAQELGTQFTVALGKEKIHCFPDQF